MFLIRATILISLVASAYGVCPTTPAGGCSVCGKDKCVSKPDALFLSPLQTPITCFNLQQKGYAGDQQIVAGCALMPNLVEPSCACTSDGLPSPTRKPTPPKPTPKPTPKPRLNPTPKPTRKPTRKPTPKPTTRRLPTKRPTLRISTLKPNLSIP